MDGVRKAVRQDMFVLEMDDGETWTIPGTNSTIRFIADKSTAPFAVIHSRGMPDAAVPPHFHKFAIDTWLILQGKLKVWAGDQGRVLCAGDFAFVPPGTTHSYQVVEPHTEFVGVIHPSEWTDFFRAIAEIYNGPGPFPSNDKREFPKDKFIQAIKDGHDVIPQFQHRFPEASHDWADNEVPRKPQAYYLKAHTGPRYALGGQTCAPICRAEATEGKFSISFLEGHREIPHPKALASVKLGGCLVILSHVGAWNLEVDGKSTVIATGDSAYIPPGATYSLLPKSKFARAMLFSEGAGPGAIFETAGKQIQGVIGSGEVANDSFEVGTIAEAAKELKMALPAVHASA